MRKSRGNTACDGLKIMKKTIQVTMELVPADELKATSRGWVTIYKATPESEAEFASLEGCSVKLWVGVMQDKLPAGMTAKQTAPKVSKAKKALTAW